MTQHLPIKTVLVFHELQVAVCDTNGEQLPELQVSLAALFAKHLEEHRYNPEGIIIETPFRRLKLFRTSEGKWNTQIL